MNISLREFSAGDLPTFETWVANGDLKQFMSRWAPRSFVSGRLLDDRTIWHVIVADGRGVGCVWMERDMADDGVADLGIFVAASADRGRGIGRRALKLAQGAVVERWHLRTLRLRVREGNTRAIACYIACGFKLINRGEKTVAGEKVRFLELVHRLKESNMQE